MDSQTNPTEGSPPPVDISHENAPGAPSAESAVPETRPSTTTDATTPSRETSAAPAILDATTSPVVPDAADITLARIHTLINSIYTLPVVTVEGFNAIERDVRDALRDVAVGTFPQDVLDELHGAVRERRLGLGMLGIGLEVSVNPGDVALDIDLAKLSRLETQTPPPSIGTTTAATTWPSARQPRRSWPSGARRRKRRGLENRSQHLRARLEADRYQRRHETDYEVQMREEWEEDKEEMRVMEGWIKRDGVVESQVRSALESASPPRMLA
ncbi:hypothetical protein LTR12_013439 [Friedmanniomyces endolithicus]|nr:hypothetical protein LTR74_006617 [Friedmanniomyces endolithicus]KAK1812166.1 hypothetical protein LTR12_013439 [Friedmanniomyces endolithicus]